MAKISPSALTLSDIPSTASLCASQVAGVDEVGRGPLAGSVVAAAVILPDGHGIVGLADSKKLSEKKREDLYTQICDKAVSFAWGEASVEEIDSINILHASMLAMHRAVESLGQQPQHVLVDGNRVPQWPYEATSIVSGDNRVACISAASILAKVHRDRQMLALAERYPAYGFDKHKGYPTKLHLQALANHGVLAEHRKSFGPVRRALENSLVDASASEVI